MAEPEIQSAKTSIWLRLSEGWSRWTGASANRGIFGAALTVGVFTVIAKLVSIAKELTVAGSFGTGDALDAFLIAFLLPSFTISVVAGSFNAALIPTFIRVRDQEGHEAAQRLLSSVMFWTLGLLGAAALLLFVSAPWLLPLVGSGFSVEKLALTRGLFYLLLPVLVLSGFSTIASAILNAGRSFAVPALVPMVTPAVAIAAILGAGNIWGIHALTVATLCGAVLELAILAWSLKRRGYSLWPLRQRADAAVKEVIGQYVPMVAGALLMSSSLLVDQAMAAMLGPGSVASLNYGNKVVALILGVGSLALGTAVLPYFSRMVAAGDWAGVRHTLKTYLRLILISTLALAAALVLFAQPTVSILFERGKFSAEDTKIVSTVTACFALQIPFYIAGTLGVRLLNALGKGRSIMLICIANMAANIGGNLILMRWMGVSGIALSTSAVYLLSCVQIYFVVVGELKRRKGGSGT